MDVECNDGKTPLQCITRHQSSADLRIVETLIAILLEGGADPNKTSKEQHYTPVLHWATMKRSTHLVELLLKHGVSCNTCDSQQRTALHLTCENLSGKQIYINYRLPYASIVQASTIQID